MLNLRILLVDDHPLFRDGIKSLLAARGIEVVGEARDGLEALHKARALRPDLVLMDLTMPNLGGLEATRLLKMEMPEIKVIILTASEEESDLFEAIKSGAQGYLTKSLQAETFFDLLEGVAHGEAPITRQLASKILGEFARQTREAQPAARPSQVLTEREREVLSLVAQGRTNREIGQALFLSENTIKYHLKSILAKLHLNNRAEAVAFALRSGLVNPPKDS